MEFLSSIHGTTGIAQTVKGPWEPIILSIGHSDGPTEVQLNCC